MSGINVRILPASLGKTKPHLLVIDGRWICFKYISGVFVHGVGDSHADAKLSFLISVCDFHLKQARISPTKAKPKWWEFWK